MSLFDYTILCQKLEALYRRFGVLPRVIGRTMLGRAIFALELGGPRRSLMVTGLSGTESELCAISLRFAEALLQQIADNKLFCGVAVRQAFKESGITLIPCCNPDGLEIVCRGLQSTGTMQRTLRPLVQDASAWQANARGVDLRRQFPAGFSAYQAAFLARHPNTPCASGYPGTQPLTEPEAQALAVYCRREKIRRTVLLQTGEPALLVHTPPGSIQRALLCGKLLAQESGLPLFQSEDTDGCFSAWCKEALQICAFTAQTGKGTTPLPDQVWFSFLLLTALL